MNTILKVENLQKYYGNKGNVTKAVDNISFTITEGEYIGIMGRREAEKPPFLIVFPPLMMRLPVIFILTEQM